jgi:hypothetical protein
MNLVDAHVRKKVDSFFDHPFFSAFSFLFVLFANYFVILALDGGSGSRRPVVEHAGQKGGVARVGTRKLAALCL